MKTTLELPDDLMKEVKLRAVHEGKKLKDAIAQLLRRGLDAPVNGSAAIEDADGAVQRRAGLVRKFVSGEWGVELKGLELARRVERRKSRRRTRA